MKAHGQGWACHRGRLGAVANRQNKNKSHHVIEKKGSHRRVLVRHLPLAIAKTAATTDGTPGVLGSQAWNKPFGNFALRIGATMLLKIKGNSG